MLLAIDARNREVVVGLRDDSGWRARRRCGAEGDRSADEYAQFLGLVAAEAAGTAPGPFRGPAGLVDAAWISSVVPALTPRLARAAQSAFGVEASIVGPGARTGVRIRTDNPAEVGSDLICAAAAAHELAQGSCVVVDFGAAITVSAVDAAGDFLGTAIAPGIEAAALALRATTAQIHDVRLERPRRVIGKSTAASVGAGILLGYEGLVERLVRLMQREIAAACGADPEGVAVIGSGDEAGAPLLAGLGRFVPELGLEGLAIIASRARTSPSRGSA